MTRRQRIQAAKASMLDDAAELAEDCGDPEAARSTAEALGVSTDDVQAASAELAAQLRAWAYRITPLTHDD